MVSFVESKDPTPPLVMLSNQRHRVKEVSNACMTHGQKVSQRIGAHTGKWSPPDPQPPQVWPSQLQCGHMPKYLPPEHLTPTQSHDIESRLPWSPGLPALHSCPVWGTISAWWPPHWLCLRPRMQHMQGLLSCPFLPPPKGAVAGGGYCLRAPPAIWGPVC